MTPFKKILLCVHPEITDPNVVDHAGRVARKCNAAVRVMHTISDYPEDVSEWWNVQDPEALRNRIIEERQDYLNDVSGFLRDLGVAENDTRIRWGVPAMEIIKEVVEHGHDLVIITASHKSRFAKKMLDCPSLELMRSCPATVWLAQGKISKRYRRIAVAIGDRGGDIPCDGVNERVARIGVLVADAEDAELHVIHALPLYGVSNKRIHKDSLAKLLQDKHNLVRERCRFLFREAGSDLPDDRIHIPSGSPTALQIKKTIMAKKINLVVMGSAMSGDSGMVLGATSEKVFTHTKVSVVSVKPPDFSCQMTWNDPIQPQAVDGLD